VILAVPLRFVCAWCQRVRTAQGKWVRAESLEMRPAEASHGICPECLEQETRAAAEAPLLAHR
jgi:hypothetical protein